MMEPRLRAGSGLRHRDRPPCPEQAATCSSRRIASVSSLLLSSPGLRHIHGDSAAACRGRQSNSGGSEDEQPFAAWIDLFWREAAAGLGGRAFPLAAASINCARAPQQNRPPAPAANDFAASPTTSPPHRLPETRVLGALQPRIAILRRRRLPAQSHPRIACTSLRPSAALP